MKTKDTLKQLKADLDNAFVRYSETSRDALIKTLAPGTPLPQNNRIYGDTYLDAFREEAAAIRKKAYDAINAERTRIAKEKTITPSTESVNAVSMMKLTSDLSADDITNALNRFGENYTTFRAIRSIAQDAGIKGVVKEHELDKASAGLDFIEQKVASAFSSVAYEKDGTQVASTVGFNTIIDSELTE